MNRMQILPRELTRPDRPALERHFLALEAEDRRLRFGAPLNDFAVRTYVVRIDFDADAAFGVFDDDLHLVGAAHLGRSRGHAELGVSVLAGHRGRGIGGALLARAHMHARNWGVRALFMHCLTENRAMMHLARKQGMVIAAAEVVVHRSVHAGR
ncbi:MAG TPA: GNAT family N-acetyltransferase, partial [Burkholderiales bacterium]